MLRYLIIIINIIGRGVFSPLLLCLSASKLSPPGTNTPLEYVFDRRLIVLISKKVFFPVFED